MRAVSLLISLVIASLEYFHRSFNAMPVNLTDQILRVVFTTHDYIAHAHAHACLPYISAVIAIVRSVAPL